MYTFVSEDPRLKIVIQANESISSNISARRVPAPNLNTPVQGMRAPLILILNADPFATICLAAAPRGSRDRGARSRAQLMPPPPRVRAARAHSTHTRVIYTRSVEGPRGYRT